MDTQLLAQEISVLHADICSALADPRRILMLYVLSEKRLNVSDLAEEVGITQPAASRHLKLLRERGLVRAERHGANVEYHLTDHRLIEALDLLRAVLYDRIHHQASLLQPEDEGRA
jgi:ArsR family transcriptional regulator